MRRALVSVALVASVLLPVAAAAPATAHGKQCPARYDLIPAEGNFASADLNGNGSVCILYYKRSIRDLTDDHIH